MYFIYLIHNDSVKFYPVALTIYTACTCPRGNTSVEKDLSQMILLDIHGALHTQISIKIITIPFRGNVHFLLISDLRIKFKKLYANFLNNLKDIISIT